MKSTTAPLERQREWMSALADGQLHGQEFNDAMDALASGDDARTAWHTYHLIGDALRAEQGGGSVQHDASFLRAVRRRLAAEPVWPREVAAPVPVAEAAVAPDWLPEPAANDGLWHWKWVAGLASVAVVGTLGWGLITGLAGPSDPVLAESAPDTIQVRTPQGVVLRDPQLDDLLAAHKQHGGASALQTATGFLRNATFDGQDR